LWAHKYFALFDLRIFSQGASPGVPASQSGFQTPDIALANSVGVLLRDLDKPLIRGHHQYLYSDLLPYQ
jgi:hypothetical protein